MDIFDIIGPIMIGPSSSHTAGAARLGLLARKILQEDAIKGDITLYGSFAKTYKGHGTDKAIVAGILGMMADDANIKNALDIAKQKKLEINFEFANDEKLHPNSVKILLKSKSGKTVKVLGSSIGGGNIKISMINELEVEFSATMMTVIVLHYDVPGTIAAVSKILRDANVNIANFKFSRNKKTKVAIMCIELDAIIEKKVNDMISKLENVISSTPIMPLD